MLGSEPDIQVVGLAVDGQDGVEKAAALQPDVVTLDIQMPRMGGLEALKRIMADAARPGAASLVADHGREPTSRSTASSWAPWTSSTSRGSRGT